MSTKTIFKWSLTDLNSEISLPKTGFIPRLKNLVYPPKQVSILCAHQYTYTYIYNHIEG